MYQMPLWVGAVAPDNYRVAVNKKGSEPGWERAEKEKIQQPKRF